jgi:hypothetical protein
MQGVGCEGVSLACSLLLLFLKMVGDGLEMARWIHE